MTENIEERRSFLNKSLKAVGAVGVVGILYSAINFLSRGDVDVKSASGANNAQAGVAGSKPSASAASQPSQDGTAEIAAASLPEGAAMMISVGYKPVIVVHRKDGFVAFEGTCTHLGCLVKWDNQINQFACPCHGGSYDKDGQVLAGPPPLSLRKCGITDQNNGKMKISPAV